MAAADAAAGVDVVPAAKAIDLALLIEKGVDPHGFMQGKEGTFTEISISNLPEHPLEAGRILESLLEWLLALAGYDLASVKKIVIDLPYQLLVADLREGLFPLVQGLKNLQVVEIVGVDWETLKHLGRNCLLVKTLDISGSRGLTSSQKKRLLRYFPAVERLDGWLWYNQGVFLVIYRELKTRNPLVYNEVFLGRQMKDRVSPISDYTDSDSSSSEDDSYDVSEFVPKGAVN